MQQQSASAGPAAPTEPQNVLYHAGLDCDAAACTPRRPARRARTPSERQQGRTWGVVRSNGRRRTEYAAQAGPRRPSRCQCGGKLAVDAICVMAASRQGALISGEVDGSIRRSAAQRGCSLPSADLDAGSRQTDPAVRAARPIADSSSRIASSSAATALVETPAQEASRRRQGPLPLHRVIEDFPRLRSTSATLGNRCGATRASPAAGALVKGGRGWSTATATEPRPELMLERNATTSGGGCETEKTNRAGLHCAARFRQAALPGPITTRSRAARRTDSRSEVRPRRSNQTPSIRAPSLAPAATREERTS